MPYVIAEIGCNHQGEMRIARRMIEVAAGCGTNAVKFQKRDVSLLPEKLRAAPYDGFGRTYGEHREALEFSREQHRSLRGYARECGVGFACTPYDLPSLELVAGLGPDYIKIASCSLTDLELLRSARGAGYPLIVSTGMSTDAEVQAAMLLLRDASVTLLQCTSAYPCDEGDVNLRVMESYRERYGCTVGLSDHTRGIAVSIAATALGAAMIERHFTLDRTWRGTDHAASLEPEGLRRLVRDCRNVELAMGSGKKERLPCEEGAWRKLRNKCLC